MRLALSQMPQADLVSHPPLQAALPKQRTDSQTGVQVVSSLPSRPPSPNANQSLRGCGCHVEAVMAQIPAGTECTCENSKPARPANVGPIRSALATTTADLDRSLVGSAGSQ